MRFDELCLTIRVRGRKKTYVTEIITNYLTSLEYYLIALHNIYIVKSIFPIFSFNFLKFSFDLKLLLMKDLFLKGLTLNANSLSVVQQAGSERGRQMVLFDYSSVS